MLERNRDYIGAFKDEELIKYDLKGNHTWEACYQSCQLDQGEVGLGSCLGS